VYDAARIAQSGKLDLNTCRGGRSDGYESGTEEASDPRDRLEEPDHVASDYLVHVPAMAGPVEK
jgi:hypothetical protein